MIVKKIVEDFLFISMIQIQDLLGRDHYDPEDQDLNKLEQAPPVIFIAGRPKASLLFWFFGDFRCGALLFMVIYVIYTYINR